MPRYFGNGSFHSVQLTRFEVGEWSQSWPCFGTAKSVWFQFEKKSGDMVDCSDISGMDESAVLALTHDAQYWCETRADGRRIAFSAIIRGNIKRA